MSETAGQAACVAWNEHYAEQYGIEARNEWAASDSRGRAAWEAAAAAARKPLRDGIAALLADVTKSADTTRPSKKTAIEDELAAQLRQILDSP